MKLKLIITLTIMSLFCPTVPAFGLDLRIKENVRAFVEQRDKMLQTATLKVNQKYNTTSALFTGFTKGGFSIFESRTGLNKRNEDKTQKLYVAAKNRILRGVGVRLGVAEGTKDLALEMADFSAQLVTLPAGLVNLGYNIKEDPQKYKKSAVSGAKTITSMLTNPGSLLSALYQEYKITEKEAQKDPLTMGKIQGKSAVYAGTFLLGGGQVKSVSAAKKVGTLTKAGNTVNNLMPRMKKGLLVFKNDQTATFLPSQKLLFTLNVGDMFEGVKIIQKEGNLLTLANGVKLYENARKVDGEDIFAKIDYAKFTTKQGLLFDESERLANGRFLYVIDYYDNLLLTKKGKAKFHSQLPLGKPVKYAGELQLEDGMVKMINRVSGHYLPKTEHFGEIFPTLQRYLPGITKELFTPDIPDWLGNLIK